MKKLAVILTVLASLGLVLASCGAKPSTWSVLEIQNIESVGDNQYEVQITSPIEVDASTLRVGDTYHGLEVLAIDYEGITLLGLNGKRVRINKGDSKTVIMEE